MPDSWGGNISLELTHREAEEGTLELDISHGGIFGKRGVSWNE